MQTKKACRRVKVLQGSEFSWPVKIRVRANTLSVAPRKSPIFPAGNHLAEIKMLLPPLSVLSPAGARRATEAFKRWLAKERRTQPC